MNTLTKPQMIDLLKEIQYKDWIFTLIEENDILFLQVSFIRASAFDETRIMKHFGRKWRISPRTSKSEFVQTAFVAIITAEEHEIREDFKYKGAAIFAPHYNVDALISLYEKKSFDMRINSYDVEN